MSGQSEMIGVDWGKNSWSNDICRIVGQQRLLLVRHIQEMTK